MKYKQISFINKVYNMELFECEFCSKTFNQKFNLNHHQKTAKFCLSIRGKQNESFKCEYCEKKFTTKSTLIEHKCIIKEKQQCILYKRQYEEKEKEIEKYVKKIDQKDKEIEKYKREIEKNNEIFCHKQEIENLKCKNYLDDIFEKDNQIKTLNSMIENLNSTIKELAEKAIEKPSISKNINTNIKNFKNIQNILTDSTTYKERTDHKRITEIARNNIEEYFWKGQKGMAQFCVDHIVRTSDGKMILCCTDPARKRFKFMNADGDLKDDIEARIFTKDISIPIISVCEEMYNHIMEKIEEDNKDSSSDKGYLNIKREMAMQRYLEITHMDNNQENGDYKNELSLLLKSL